jgi:hypothetical protein
MKAPNETTGSGDRSVMLATLCIFVMFNYIYADILTLYFNPALHPDAWQRFLSGQTEAIRTTQGFALVAAIVLEIAIGMVLLARVLPYQANRWANVIAAVIETAAVALLVTRPLYLNLYYVFFAVIEIACTLFIVWYAWTWPRSQRGLLARGQPGVA